MAARPPKRLGAVVKMPKGFTPEATYTIQFVDDKGVTWEARGVMFAKAPTYATLPNEQG